MQMRKFTHKHVTILKLIFVESLDILAAACEDNNICLYQSLRVLIIKYIVRV